MGAAIDLYQATGVDYRAALEWQREAAASVRAGGSEALALIEHAPVYTMGRRGGRESLAVAPEALRAPVVDVERGGDITWHGPGQLVGYPIIDLRARELRAGDYVHRLERVLIDALAAFDVDGRIVVGRPGVWVEDAKIAAVGVAIRGGVSMHGFALNVAPDLAWFDDIVPCGLADARVTSLARIVESPPSIERVVDAVRAAFEAHFDARLVEVPSFALDAAVPA